MPTSRWRPSPQRSGKRASSWRTSPGIWPAIATPSISTASLWLRLRSAWGSSWASCAPSAPPWKPSSSAGTQRRPSSASSTTPMRTWPVPKRPLRRPRRLWPRRRPPTTMPGLRRPRSSPRRSTRCWRVWRWERRPSCAPWNRCPARAGAPRAARASSSSSSRAPLCSPGPWPASPPAARSAASCSPSRWPWAMRTAPRPSSSTKWMPAWAAAPPMRSPPCWRSWRKATRSSPSRIWPKCPCSPMPTTR